MSIDNSTEKEGIAKFISFKFIIIALLIISGLMFVYIAHEAVYEKEKGFDDAVFAFVSSISTPGFIQTMKVFTFFGSVQFLIPAYTLVIGFLFFKRKFAYGIDVFIIGMGSTLLNQGLKVIFHRHRPDHPIISGVVNYSFPSGHALSAFVFCSILIYILYKFQINKAFKSAGLVFLILFAISIGLSRITLKVHFPTDVLASFCLGSIWVISCFWLFNYINHRYHWGQSRIENREGDSIEIK